MAANDVSIPVQHQRDQIAKQAADASIQLEQLKAAYASSPEMKLAADRAELNRLQSDPYTLDHHRRSIQVLSDRIAAAEAAGSGPSTDADRVDRALTGVPVTGPSATFGDQIPEADFSSAVQDDIAAGVKPELIKSYLSTGRSDDPLGHVAAQFWLDLFERDAGMQRRYQDGDPVMRRRFKTAQYYLAGKHEGADPAAERALAARLTRGDN
jgi:hypothetical protein